MSRSHKHGRAAVTSVALAALGALVAGGLTALPAEAAPGSSATTSRDQLGKHDRQLLAAARAADDTTVQLLVAAAPGRSSSVASAMTALGATVVKREDAVDYLRVRVPVGKAAAVANVKDVVAADLDEVVPLEDPTPGEDGDGTDGATVPTPGPAPSSSTPQANPYMPVRDTKAVDFQQAHPTWDGRGTTIAIVDSGIDLDHPALQTTTTGERKIVDWVTATDQTGDADPTWLDMKNQVSATPDFTGAGTTWTAPAAGTYRFAIFDERDPRLGGEVGSDVNRDGNPAGSKGTFGVLWDAGTNDVWVDTDQDGSFSDESAMTDYRVRHDIGHFGTDKPGTQIREQMPFVVQTDGRTKFVNIGIVSGAHGSHVAGITAANGMFGGEMTGAAPGAKLKAVRVCMFITGCTNHALIEGMTFIAKQGNVDVINMSIGGLPSLNDGNNTRAVLYDRLIDTYNVQMFISAGNSGAGLNTIGDPSVASKVVSVGSYITNDDVAEQLRLVHGQRRQHPPLLLARPDGGRRLQAADPRARVGRLDDPDLAGPAGAVPALRTARRATRCSTAPRWRRRRRPARRRCSSRPRSRPASRSSRRSCGRRSRPARASSTDYQAFEQGNGLMDVTRPGTCSSRTSKTVSITSSVPVNTVLSGFLATPGFGTGIYNREGVKAGDSYTRTYTFTRTSGGGGTETYDLSWVGNDGTFSSPTSLALPLNSPVKLTVSVNPTTSGIHSAVLNLDDPTHPGVEAQTMNTVVAAEQFTAAGNYSVTKTGTIARNQAKSFFFAVPAGTPAFKVDMTAGGATGTRPGPLPAVPPLRGGSRGQLHAQLLQPAGGGRLHVRWRTEPHDGQPAGRRLGGRGRGASHVGRPRSAVLDHGVDPRRRGRARPGRGRHRRAEHPGQPQLHHDQPVR